MTSDPLYKKEHFKETSWNEAVEIMDRLVQEVRAYLKQNSLKVDAVMPMMRGGGIPGTYMAYQLEVMRVLPIQYHYFFHNEHIELRQLYGPDQYKKILSNSPTLLLVEDNHCFGRTAAQASQDIRTVFKNAHIVYVAFQMDYGFQDVVEANVQFFGRLTNECRTLGFDEAKKLGVRPYSYLLPWEHMSEEWTTIEAKQVEYQDVEQAKNTFTVKQVIKDLH
jgi:hypothetical protein